MQTMKNPAILGLLILGITGAGLAADGQEAPISLEAAREHAALRLDEHHRARDIENNSEKGSASHRD